MPLIVEDLYRRAGKLLGRHLLRLDVLVDLCQVLAQPLALQNGGCFSSVSCAFPPGDVPAQARSKGAGERT